MLSRYHSIVAYFKFLISSVNQHGVHSPFVYKLVTECFYDKKKHSGYRIIKNYRKELLTDNQLLNVTDHGAGSKVFTNPQRKVKNIALNAGISLKRAFLLYRLTSYLQCKKALELGTSLGISTTAIALANNEISVKTIEGCPETIAFAKKQFEKYDISNVQAINATFENALQEETGFMYDLIYIDGHHSRQPTISYFTTLLKYVHNDSVMIFDDIHWSKGMEDAWKTIANHPEVTVSIDTYKWGILFFRKEQVKEHFIIRI
jgi:predicted O-methyltransferase YrrM